MLVLSRKVGERIMIGEGITLEVVRIKGDKVQLGIEADKSIPINREEIQRRIELEQQKRDEEEQQ